MSRRARRLQAVWVREDLEAEKKRAQVNVERAVARVRQLILGDGTPWEEAFEQPDDGVDPLDAHKRRPTR